MRRRQFGLWAARVALLWFAAAIIPRAAEAHAALLHAKPAAGDVLMTSPHEIRLIFDEEILPSLAGLVLVQTDGTELNLRGANDSHDVHVLTASLPVLPPGGYVVKWKVISADGHTVSGSYGFVVGTPPALSSTPALLQHQPPPPENAFPVLPSLLRGLGMSALLALTGMLGFLTRPKGDRGPAVRPMIQRLGVLAFVALALHLIFWLWYLDAPSWRVVLDSTPGRLEQLRVILALVLMLSVVSASKRSLGLMFGVMALIVSSIIGHPGTTRPILSIPIVLVHIGAVAVWLGGLTWLVAHRAEPPVRVAFEATRVSSASLFAALGVLITGVLQTLLFLPRLSDLFSTMYGGILLGKIAGIAVLMLFGWYHRYRLLPKLTADSNFDFSRTIRYEITIMVTVVILAAFLSYTPIPR